VVGDYAAFGTSIAAASAEMFVTLKRVLDPKLVNFLRSSVMGMSIERHPNASDFAPDDVAGIDFLFRYDQCELIGDAGLRSYVQSGPALRQIANNATGRRLAEPDQSSI